MKYYTIVILLLCSSALFAQKNVVHIDPNYFNRHLFINVVDVIDHQPVSGFKLIIERKDDSTKWISDTAGQMPFQLNAGNQYHIRVIKAGYDTLNVFWTQPNDTADTYVDFYMRKTSMTPHEKKAAIKASRRPLMRLTGQEDGYEYVGIEKNSMCESRVDIYTANGQCFSFWWEHK